MTDDPIDAAIASLGGTGGSVTPRSMLGPQGQSIAALEPDEMRSHLLTHPLSRGGRLWCDRIIEGVNRGDRTAMRLFGEAMKWVGATVNIGQVLFAQIGVRDEAEMKSLVESGRRLQSITADATASLEATAAEAEAFLSEYWQAHPERRSAFLEALGAKAALPPHTNGDGQ